MRRIAVLFVLAFSCLMAPLETASAAESIVVGQPCTQLGVSGMTEDKHYIATCLYSDGANQPYLIWKVPGQMMVKYIIGGQTCTTGHGSYATCTVTYNFSDNSSFPDNNYVVACNLVGPFDYDPVLRGVWHDVSSVTLLIQNGTADGAQNVSAAGAYCIAVHP